MCAMHRGRHRTLADPLLGLLRLLCLYQLLFELAQVLIELTDMLIDLSITHTLTHTITIMIAMDSRDINAAYHLVGLHSESHFLVGIL